MDTQIKLDSVQVTNLSLETKTFNPSVTATNDLETTLNFGQAYSEEDSKKFSILFKVVISNPNKDFVMSVNVTAHFESSVNVDNEFKKSSFVQISAPAIAFPFVRAFISNLTLNSGYNPIILPSFNFIKIADDNQKEMMNKEE
jgi:preprotein translocase subunit SecB